MIRKSFALLALCLSVSACSTNEATGRSQFTGLMNTAQENQTGSSEQTKVQQEFGTVDNAALNSYVSGICARLVPTLERHDVNYTCTVLDSPVVNAFALPGGYININRGLIAYANNEAELASVLAHEMGHVTARHIAERYSQAALTQLGGAVASAALGSDAATQLIGLGSNLYLTSYSRSQESEADDLGIRYLNRAGYDPMAMASFLATLQRESALEAAEKGQEYKEMRNFMATHPMTADRVARASALAANIPDKGTNTGADRHLNVISGMTFGDSAKDGYVKGEEFIHPSMGFAFLAPNSFIIKNAPEQVVGQSRSNSGATFVFNGAAKPSGMAPANYIQELWIKGQGGLTNVESITVNGMRAATGQIQGTINNRPALMRLVAVEWSPTQVFRFQFAMPQDTGAAEIEVFKRMTYSLRRLNPGEGAAINPKRIALVTARAGDTVESLSRSMAFDDSLNTQRFRTLNGMNPNDQVTAGRRYKTIVQ